MDRPGTPAGRVPPVGVCRPAKSPLAEDTAFLFLVPDGRASTRDRRAAIVAGRG